MPGLMHKCASGVKPFREIRCSNFTQAALCTAEQAVALSGIAG